MSYGNYDLADWCEPILRREAESPSARAGFVLEKGQWFLHPSYHPFHLVYRGEPLRVEAMAGEPQARAELEYVITDDLGRRVLDGKENLPFEQHTGQSARAAAQIPLAKLANGLWTATLRLHSGGAVKCERTLRFGLVDSRIGRPSEGTPFGVNHHEFMSSYEPFAAAGIEWSRQWFCWAWIEPQKGTWRWNWHDERMAAAEEFHVKTIGVLGGIGQPAWSSPDNVEPGEFATHGFPANLDDWAEYVRQVATRYRGKVRVWESWNETEGACRGNLRGWSVKNYAELHRITYKVLKQTDPENKVLVCADTLRFVDDLLAAGLGDTYDGIVIHPYRREAPDAQVGSTGDFVGVLAKAKDWLRAHGKPSGEVWATEIGWALTGRGWVTVSEKTHGDYLARTYILAQVSQNAAAVCWHDFALGMFGIFDGKGYPRPAYMAYGPLISTLSGARPVREFKVSEHVRGALFQKPTEQVLALWSPMGLGAASVKLDSEVVGTRRDLYGNPAPFRTSLKQTRVCLTESPTYICAAKLPVTEITPLPPMFSLGVEPRSVTAGHRFALRLDVTNHLDGEGEFHFSVHPADGMTIEPAEGSLSAAPGAAKSQAITVSTARPLAPGMREMKVTATSPDNVKTELTAVVEVTTPLMLTVRPADPKSKLRLPLSLVADTANRDDRPYSGRVELSVPPGFSIQPTQHAFELPPGGTATMQCELTSTRGATVKDMLTATCATDDGLKIACAKSLLPVVVDADGNGLADGWKINPENTAVTSARNAATVSIEPGHTEFLCQRIRCTRFTDGWIILHRDNQDTIVKGRRYRITFSARQEGLKGGLGVAVYNIKPWQSCGIEEHHQLSNDWQTITTEFVAKRDSTNVRFEFFFTETGTVWIENMRLQEIGK
jgi:hypothetical protein